MKRCAQCHGRLGLGVRSRNLWSVKLFTSWSNTTRRHVAGASSPQSAELTAANCRSHHRPLYAELR
jgi:hypothetical protein